MLHTQENGGGKLTHRLHLHRMFFLFYNYVFLFFDSILLTHHLHLHHGMFFVFLFYLSLTMIIQMELKRGHL